ncbi:MAG: hypothetical protein IBX62_05495 [Coriobacteriia bacterium]|nr:hypothetical protein [Coriobacteriia bacterium]
MPGEARAKGSVESSLAEGKDAVATRALAEPAAMRRLLEALSGPGRTERARAAEALHEVACREPQALKPYASELIDALERPEVQTRWEVLGGLEELARVDARLLDKAIAPATVSLHDAESGVVRVAAFRMLAAYGSTTARRAERIWPLLDEALRAYHGDPEYPGMLAGVVTLVEGAAPEAVRADAARTVEPETTHPRAAISRQAKRIVARGPKNPGA